MPRKIAPTLRHVLDTRDARDAEAATRVAADRELRALLAVAKAAQAITGVLHGMRYVKETTGAEDVARSAPSPACPRPRRDAGRERHDG